MLNKPPIQPSQTAQVVACPPRRPAKPADPCAMVISGATGDLTKRLVVPALYNLLRTKVLPEISRRSASPGRPEPLEAGATSFMAC